MPIKRISREEIEAAGVSSLSTRPNSISRYGVSGMTPSELRAAFDSLAKLAISRLNQVIDAINAAGGDSEDNILSLIYTPIIKNGDTYLTLYEYLECLSKYGTGVSPEISSLLEDKADKNHDHDDIYLRTVAIDALLAGKLAAKPDGSTALITANGKIASSYLPDSSLGQLNYIGTFTIALPTEVTDGSEKRNVRKGDYAIAGEGVSVSGYETGDWAVYNGTSWDKIDNTDAVQSVNGKTGAVSLAAQDMTVTDAAGYFSAGTVEGVLGEIGGTLSGLESALASI